MLFDHPPRIDLTGEEFELLSAFIYDYCGLYFDDSSKFLLESRLQNRLRIHHFDSFLKYYQYLLYHPEKMKEINELIDVLTTNETYFLREMKQLDAFSMEILPELAQRNARTKRLNIWSAGCSTGEEPYTLAILLARTGLFSQDWNINIIGTDISQRVLKTARKAVYTQSSFRVTEKEYIDRYFNEIDGKSHLDDSIRSMVQFGHINLLDGKMLGLISACDIIMCRNVIIYFDGNAKARVVNSFHKKLSPGGYLLLGHSESLMNITTAFKLRHLKHAMVYQKAGEEHS